jgi:acyl-CoA synthetase (AMP-forming)/AMP-acid ligase II
MDVASFLCRAVQLYPQNLSVIDEDGLRLTYAQLDLLVRKTACAIRSSFPANGHFCVLSHNSSNFFMLSYALAYARVVMVPVNWRCSAEELAFIIQNANCSGVFLV